MTERLVTLLLEEESEEELLLIEMLRKRKRKPEKKLYKGRATEGYYNLLINNHFLQDNETFQQFFRINKKQFDFILNCVGDNISKTKTNRVKIPISPNEKLYLTLRFLATGETYTSLSFAFRISASYISVIIPQVLKEMCNKLVPIFLPIPSIADFERIAEEFYQKWNFPNCIGAIDGKHVRIFCPRRSGSLFFNYKGYFSTVLLAIVDANYKFVIVDVGSYGKEGDSGIFEKSNMGQKIRAGTFNFPPEKVLPQTGILLSHVIVGDEAFKLDRHMMKPYTKQQAHENNSKAIFNYRLCRSRRVAENAFALLSQLFRIFYSPIAILPETTDLVVMVTCCLHNMLRDEYTNSDAGSNHGVSDLEIPSENMIRLRRTGGFANLEGFQVRDQFTNYFSSRQGSIEWQERQVNRVN